jgi:hypothetical protein
MKIPGLMSQMRSNLPEYLNYAVDENADESFFYDGYYGEDAPKVNISTPRRLTAAFQILVGILDLERKSSTDKFKALEERIEELENTRCTCSCDDC